MVVAIVLASGKATRMGSGLDKCFLSLGNMPVVAWSLLAFEKCAAVDRIVLTVRKDQLGAARSLQAMFGISKLKSIVVGGARRQDSVLAALKEVPTFDCPQVVIHDAARPCITPELITETLKSAKRFGSGIAACPVVDTIKVVGKGNLVESTPPRDNLWAVQTPQAFSTELLRSAYERLATDKKVAYTDDSAVVEASGTATHLVKWLAPNPKITTAIDLTITAAILRLN